MPTIEQRVRQVEDDLETITQRLFLFEAFSKEFERITRGKAFRIWGSAVWMIILDSRDTHVSHLASWARALYGKGGFFGQLPAHHIKEFPRKWKKRGNVKADGHFAEVLKRQHMVAFNRLFPAATGSFPTPEDFDKLRDQFCAIVAPIVDDRDSNRAHPYEKPGSAKASALMLNFQDLRRLTTTLEKWLNDLRLLCLCSSRAYNDMNWQDVHTLAEELVDAVLLGSRPREFIGERDRDVFYKRMHAQHDKLEDPSSQLFNDERKSPRQRSRSPKPKART